MRLAALSLIFFAAAPAFSADGPKFDAVSVKLSGPDVQPPWTTSGGPGTRDPGQFRAPRINMSALLTTAFDVQADQIIGPDWLRSFSQGYCYSVVAAVPAGATKEQFQKMLQNMLIERFHLVYHREKRDFPGYELVVDAGGPKFKEVTPTEDPVDNAKIDLESVVKGERDADGFLKVPPGPRKVIMGTKLSSRTKYQEQTMADFISNLGFLIGSSQGKSVVDGYMQPRVVDKTGLKGKYTFILEYSDVSWERMRLALPEEQRADPAGPDDPGAGAPNIIDAVQKQLGLRLDKVAAVPLDVIVIDSVGKTPTEN